MTHIHKDIKLFQLLPCNLENDHIGWYDMVKPNTGYDPANFENLLKQHQKKKKNA